MQTQDIDPAFGNWLAGFIDGEGCFRIEHVHRRSWACMFSLALRDDDSAIIEEIVERTGIGTIRRPGIRPSARHNDRPQIIWYVWGKENCAALIRILDAHPLRAKKARDYTLWREAVLYWLTLRPRYGGRHGMMRHNWGPIPGLHQQLKDTRAYDPPPPRREPEPPLRLW